VAPQSVGCANLVLWCEIPDSTRSQPGGHFCSAACAGALDQEPRVPPSSPSTWSSRRERPLRGAVAASRRDSLSATARTRRS